MCVLHIISGISKRPFKITTPDAIDENKKMRSEDFSAEKDRGSAPDNGMPHANLVLYISRTFLQDIVIVLLPFVQQSFNCGVYLSKYLYPGTDRSQNRRQLLSLT